MGDIPSHTNFSSALHTGSSRRRVAELYRPLGWEVRKCGWSEYEMRCPFAELVIEAESPFLMHGEVADVITNAERILAPLREAGVSYSAEIYDEQGELLREFKSGAV
jgi:hypothetical protein